MESNKAILREQVLTHSYFIPEGKLYVPWVDAIMKMGCGECLFRNDVVNAFKVKVKSASVQPSVLLRAGYNKINEVTQEEIQLKGRLRKLFRGTPVMNTGQYKWFNSMMNTYMAGQLNAVYNNFNIAWQNARHGAGNSDTSVENSVCIALKEKYGIKVPMTISGNIDVSFSLPDDFADDEDFSLFFESSSYVGLSAESQPIAFVNFHVFFVFEPASVDLPLDADLTKAKNAIDVVVDYTEHIPVFDRESIEKEEGIPVSCYISPVRDGELSLLPNIAAIVKSHEKTYKVTKTFFDKKVLAHSKKIEDATAKLSEKFKALNALKRRKRKRDDDENENA